MDRRELLEYAQRRRSTINKNKTGDVFCAACFQATFPDEKSECCERDVLSKDEALSRLEVIIKKLRFAVPMSEKIQSVEE
jgi:hypothetical protein